MLITWGRGLNAYAVFYEGSKGHTFRKLSIKEYHLEDSACSKCPFCVECLIPFLMVLDKWGMAQLDFLSCYLGIKKISFVKSFCEIRWRVLLEGKILKSQFENDFYPGNEPRVRPFGDRQLIVLHFDVTEWRLHGFHLLFSWFHLSLSPSPAWEVQLLVVHQD